MTDLIDVIQVILMALAVYYTAANLIYLLLFVAANYMIKERGHVEVLKQHNSKKLSVLIAAWNEEACIVNNVQTCLNNLYENKEIIVINDGSGDGTFEVLDREYQLYLYEDCDEYRVFRSRASKNLLVIDKQNTGKSDSLNLGIQYAKGEYISSIDADTVIEPDAFIRTISLIEESESRKAVGGSVRILNGAVVKNGKILRGSLPMAQIGMFQVIEYIRVFFGGRLGWEYLGGTALISGAFAVFRREALLAIGGFDRDSVTEDFEIIVRMKKHYSDLNQKCEFSMVPGPVCWTVVPESWIELLGQRVRWQRGLIQTLWKHRSILFRLRYGALGLLTLPQMAIFEGLSPFVELIGYGTVLILFWNDPIAIVSVMKFILVGVIFYVSLTLGSIRLEETHYARHDNKKPRLRFIFFSILEVFYYRQFLFAARLWGTLMAFKKGRIWLKHQRTKVEQKAA